MPGYLPFDNDFSTRPNYVNYEHIGERDLINIFKRLLDLRQLKEIKLNKEDIKNQKIYSNKDFWKKTQEREIFIGQVVNLENFIVTEWIPFSPGLYYSDYAQFARIEAEKYVNYEFREYTPQGKLSMVNGGVGSIRLAPKLITGKEFNILGATSTGITHQGLPLLVNNDVYQQHISQIKYNRGIRATIIGRIRLIEDSKIIKANFYENIPKYCVEVEEFVDAENVYEDILVTVAIAYRNSQSLNPSWTYTTIEPDRRDNHLSIATEWLVKYIERYAGKDGFHTMVLNDFDEHVNWFPNTDFSLNNIIENKGINTKLLKDYFQANHITIEGDVIIGNDNLIIKNSDNSNININR